MNTPDVKEAIARTTELPTLPQTLHQFLAALSEPDASALELGRLIATDQSLAAALLRQVNSAYYGFYRQISSVPEAVVILGFRETRNLILTTSVFRSLPHSRSSYDRGQLWRHSLAAALLSDRAANVLKIPSEPAFFSVGLLHDIGKVVLDFLYPDQYLDAIILARQSETPLQETERAVFGLDHAEAGGLLAERWNLPVTLVEAIRLHHATDTVPAPPRLAALGAVADYLAHEAGFGEGPSEMPPPYPRTSATALGMDDAVWRSIVDAFVSAHDRVDALLVATAA